VGYNVIAFASAEDFLAFPRAPGPACLLLDLRMPLMSGVELQERLEKTDSAIPIVFMTGYGDVSTSVKAMKAGAVDFLLKPVSKAELLGAIDSAISRHRMALARISSREKTVALVQTLTPREREVLFHVVRGRLSKQIAYDLHITVRTVKAHRQRVMSKFGVQSIAKLIALYGGVATAGDFFAPAADSTGATVSPMEETSLRDAVA
jgi:FixJ family two-component response regulator